MNPTSHLHDAIRRAIAGMLDEAGLDAMHPAEAAIVRSFMPTPRVVPSMGESQKLDPEAMWVREFLAELSDRMRDWWTEQYSSSRTLNWIENEATEADILAIATLSPAGVSMALDRRARAHLQRRIDAERPIANLRASAANARTVKRQRDEARWATLDQTNPAEADRLRKQREGTANRRRQR